MGSNDSIKEILFQLWRDGRDGTNRYIKVNEAQEKIDKLMGGSFGALADKWLREYPTFETLIFYHDKEGNGHVVITQTDQPYDWVEVFSEDIRLLDAINEKRKEVEKLQAKIRSLNREKKSVENAIKKITKPFKLTKGTM